MSPFFLGQRRDTAQLIRSPYFLGNYGNVTFLRSHLCSRGGLSLGGCTGSLCLSGGGRRGFIYCFHTSALCCGSFFCGWDLYCGSFFCGWDLYCGSFCGRDFFYGGFSSWGLCWRLRWCLLSSGNFYRSRHGLYRCRGFFYNCWLSCHLSDGHLRGCSGRRFFRCGLNSRFHGSFSSRFRCQFNGRFRSSLRDWFCRSRLSYNSFCDNFSDHLCSGCHYFCC
ncbi:hypothetical protein PBY51_020564 [Eleginops maclovinus]|uniref:Uncharacterized protein n=1 Tax=Eleginops maclovinus TaxID=56733 RepID=A0AAN8AT83_ELEMC|nr:hypothetical protein PBY51_020564 [Eleginops maclovinus]